MFDTMVTTRVTNTQINNIRVNSVSGTLIRSHDKSIITKVIPNSDLEKQLFNIEEPHYLITKQETYDARSEGNYSCRPIEHRTIKTKYAVEVLQVMLCGDFLMVEFILTGESK